MGLDISGRYDELEADEALTVVLRLCIVPLQCLTRLRR